MEHVTDTMGAAARRRAPDAQGSSRQGPPRLEIRGASKRYGAVRALREAALEVAPGEVMGLVGENGAGKSTLVKILCGVVRADTAEIRMDGTAVELGSTKRAEAAGIAVVQQELSIVDVLTVGENIALGDRRQGFWSSRKRLAEHARPHLEVVGLGDLDPRTPVTQLSVAERQLVEIARVTARDARLILLDEPTAALSDRDIERVKDVVRRLSAEGRSVIYITHRLGEIFELASRVTVLRDGVSQPPESTAQLGPQELIRRMLGRPLENMFPDRRARRDGDFVLEVRGLQTDGLQSPTSFDVHAGEIVGLAGQVGSGASDLLRALGGAQLVQGGDVLVHGRPAVSASPHAALGHGIAYCSGDRKLDGFFGRRRVVENLSAPALDDVTPFGLLSRSRERALAARLASMVNFDARRLGARVGTLSGGNQQKIVLGKWIGAKPTVLLIDEPTRGVDVGARAEIYRHLRDLADRGLAIVFASSDTLEVQGLADRVATFFRGRLVGTYPAGEVEESTIAGDITHPKGGVV